MVILYVIQIIWWLDTKTTKYKFKDLVVRDSTWIFDWVDTSQTRPKMNAPVPVLNLKILEEPIWIFT